MTVKLPLHSHEVAIDLNKLFEKTASSADLASIRQGGTADVKLKDGTHKSPDASFYDLTPAPEGSKETQEEEANIQSNPPMVWEVAVSESPKKLAKDCARYLAASGGMINFALGTWFDCGSREEERELKKVVIWRWQRSNKFDKIENPTAEDFRNAKCGVMQRLGPDGKKEDDKLAKTPGSSFSFSAFDGKDILTWTAMGRSTTVSPLNVHPFFA